MGVKMMDTTAPEPLTLSDDNDDDGDDGCMSSQSSDYGDDGDMMTSGMPDEVTAQLAAAGWLNQRTDASVYQQRETKNEILISKSREVYVCHVVMWEKRGDFG
ncbi:hypothetical protein J6590_073992 [Homalodisca vitripennis]|nr:hypothetical protein J6590_073992 [Homalodisca vitripennis]